MRSYFVKNQTKISLKLLSSDSSSFELYRNVHNIITLSEYEEIYTSLQICTKKNARNSEIDVCLLICKIHMLIAVFNLHWLSDFSLNFIEITLGFFYFTLNMISSRLQSSVSKNKELEDTFHRQIEANQIPDSFKV